MDLKSIINRFISNSPRREFETICNHNKLTLDYNQNRKAQPILKSIFTEGEYALHFSYKTKATIVDIGAHFGFFSLFAHKNLLPDSQIIAIEPSSSNFKQLQKNCIANNANNIITINKAVSNTKEEINLYISESYNCTTIESNPQLDKNKHFNKVKTISLENILNLYNLSEIDFMKMDCEGAEYDVLFNTSKEVFNYIHTISLEFHDLKSTEWNGETLSKHLEENGYSIAQFSYSPSNLNLQYGNIVATKK